jgi:hypothetical protein
LIFDSWRGSRAAAICAFANVLAWLSFLTFSTPLDDAAFSRSDRARVQHDAGVGDGGLTMITDQPIVVAARWYGTFGSVNLADWILNLSAGLAIFFGHRLIVPSHYTEIEGIHATKRESFAIAGIGFVLSTAFWVAFGDVVSALRRWLRRRAAKASD